MTWGKTVSRAEPQDLESLDLETAYRHDHNSVEYVRIAVLPEEGGGPQGVCSFVLVQFGKDWMCKVLQACLLTSEIDMVIAGLQEAKRRMEALEVPPAEMSMTP
jgi:hypothetical protein